MRASAVRSEIIDAIEAETLDTKARAGDVVRVLRTAREPESVTERCAMVRLIQGPDRSDTNTCDAWAVTYQVSVFYAPSDDIDDRIAQDAERLAIPLESLHTAHSDVMTSDVGPLAVEENGGLVVARRDVRVLYRLDSSLLT